MAARKKFLIPSTGEMEKADQETSKVPSSFSTYKAAAPSTSGVQTRNVTNPSTSGVQTRNVLSDGQTSDGQTSVAILNKETVNKPVGTSSAEPNQADKPSLIHPASNQPDRKESKSGASKINSLLVSRRQRGNPILKFIRNIPWEFEDIVPDYQMGQTNCALFLSLRYHQLNPDYIHERLKQLGRSFALRVLLVLVDIKDPHHCLKELAKMCILSDCTLIVAFSQDEAGRYLETYKSYENKPPDLIMERTEGNHMTKLTECLTKVKRINKTDVMTLVSAFGSLEKIVNSSEEDLSLCPGFGPQKARRLFSAFHEPFLKSKRKSQASNVDDVTEGAKKGKLHIT